MRFRWTPGVVERGTALTRAEKITSIVFVLLGLFVLFESRKYPLGTIDNPGPAFLPLLLSIAMVVMSIALSVRGWRNRTPQAHRTFWPEKGGMAKVSLTFIVILLFTALLEITGYMINIFLLFLALLRPIGRQKWTWSLSIAIGASLASYLLFEKWLMIPLPKGIWFSH